MVLVGAVVVVVVAAVAEDKSTRGSTGAKKGRGMCRKMKVRMS